MKNQVLTKEQMEELIALGVDVSKASMCYINKEFIIGLEEELLVTNDKDYFDSWTPVFTVTDMLGMMPYFVTEDYEDYFYLHIEKLIDSYTCSYKSEGDYLAKGIKYLSECELEKDSVYGTFLRLIQDGKL